MARAAAGEGDAPSQGIATGLPSLAKGARWATLVHRSVTKTRLAPPLAAPAAGAARDVAQVTHTRAVTPNEACAAKDATTLNEDPMEGEGKRTATDRRYTDLLDAPSDPVHECTDSLDAPSAAVTKCTDSLDAPSASMHECTDLLDAPSVPMHECTDMLGALSDAM